MSGTPITIVIADDHAVVRQGLRLLLEAEDDLAVVGETSDIRQTCTVLREHTPSVVLLDLHMGRELSLSAMFELRSASPGTAVVILTMEDDPAFVAPAWNAGAVQAGFGLTGMRERALLAGGRLWVTSTGGGPTRAAAVLPLPHH